MKVKRWSSALVLGVAAAFGVEAQAQSLAYNYIDVGLRTGTIFDIDVTGVGAEGSYGIAPNIRLKLGADALEADDIDASAQNVALQVGYFMGLAPNVDLVVDGGLLYQNVDDFDDDTGLKIDGILRARLDQKFELNGGISYVDIFDDSETGIHLAGLLSVNPKLSLLVRYDDIGESELWTFGIRANF